jgi:hypothetical protein
MFLFLACSLLAIGVWARVVIGREASNSAVDGHYWRVAANAYRVQRRLPVRIMGKYLMEDETQAYPPFFGFFLGRICDSSVLGWVAQVLELLELAVLWWLLRSLGTASSMALVALSCYVAAPVLVVYNAQVTSRILGELFLFTAMALQIAATKFSVSPCLECAYWMASLILLGLVVATHKMTLQLHLFLLPLWWWALGAWQVPMATLCGIFLYVAVVGREFALYQFRAHLEIVHFWHRHWRDLGGHQFDLSPIYGDPCGDRSACFHVPGWRGVLKHARLLVSYAPMNLAVLPGSIIAGAWPPVWVLVWLGGVYAFALATLFVAKLKCFGGGHLYVFNAVVVGAVYISHFPATDAVLSVLAVGVGMNVISLILARRIVRARPTARHEDFAGVIAHLQQLPRSRIAVFPLQSAEAVAGETQHSVLWGGHGSGFHMLEGFYPILTRRLEVFFSRYDINWILWDGSYWRKGEEILITTNIVDRHAIQRFGRWMIARANAPIR